MNIRKFFRKPDDQRIYHFLIFLALSITFWLFTALNRDTSAYLSYNVAYENVPFGKHLLQDAPSELKLKIKGKGLDIMIERIKHKKQVITVDLSDQKLSAYSGAGRLVIPSSSFYKLFLPQLGNKLSVQNFMPDVVALSFVDKFTKTVPVSIPHTLDYGMSMGLAQAPLASPSEIRVTGPEEFLSLINIIHTDTLSHEMTEGKFSGAIAVRNDFNEAVDIELNEVNYNIHLEEYTEKIFNLPVFKNSTSPNSSIRLVPEKVTVKVLVPVSKYDQVSENDLNVFVNINKNTEKKRKLTVNVSSTKGHISHIRTYPEKVFCLYEKDG